MNLSHHSTRVGVAFRHRHERGIIRVTGKDRLGWLNGLLTNDVLAPGRDPYAAWLTPQGRMITDMFVIRNDDDTWLDVPAPLAAPLARRLDSMIFAEDVRVDDASADILPLEVCGPAAEHGVDAVRHSLAPGIAIRVRPVERPVPGAVSKRQTNISEIAKVTSVVHSAIQHELRRAASSSPRLR